MRQLYRSLIVLVCTLALAACTTGQSNGMRVRVAVDGQQLVYNISEPMSVSQFLQRRNIPLNELDHLDPSEFTPIHDDITITIVRVQEKEECTEQAVPYRTNTVQSTDLDPGVKKVLNVGVNGTERVCFNVHFENGVEKTRTQTSTTLVTQPIDEVIAIGIDTSKIEPLPISGTILYLSNGQARFMQGNSANFGLLPLGNNLDGKVFALSPDGHQLLYTRKVDTTTAANELWILTDVTNKDAKPVRLEALKNLLTATWIPAQPYIFSYSTFRPLPDNRTEALNDINIARLNSNTGAILQATPVIKVQPSGPYTSYGTELLWSPDGKNLAWAQADGVGLVDLKAGTYKKLFDFSIYKTTLSSGWLWKPSLAWSQDGLFLVATIHGQPLSGEPAENSPVFDIALAQVPNGFKIDPMVSKVGMWAMPQYSPLARNGTTYQGYVAYLKARNSLDSVSSEYDLVLADRDGSNAQVIFPGPDKQGLNPRNDGKQLFTWSPDARQLAIVYQGDVYVIDIASNHATKVTLVGNAQYPRWIR